MPELIPIAWEFSLPPPPQRRRRRRHYVCMQGKVSFVHLHPDLPSQPVSPPLGRRCVCVSDRCLLLGRMLGTGQHAITNIEAQFVASLVRRRHIPVVATRSQIHRTRRTQKATHVGMMRWRFLTRGSGGTMSADCRYWQSKPVL